MYSNQSLILLRFNFPGIFWLLIHSATKSSRRYFFFKYYTTWLSWGFLFIARNIRRKICVIIQKEIRDYFPCDMLLILKWLIMIIKKINSRQLFSSLILIRIYNDSAVRHLSLNWLCFILFYVLLYFCFGWRMLLKQFVLSKSRKFFIFWPLYIIYIFSTW